MKIVLHALTNINIQDAKAITTSKDTKKNIEIGDHGADFCANDFRHYQWHLAIVEKIVYTEIVQLSFLKRMDSAGKDWYFLKE